MRIFTKGNRVTFQINNRVRHFLNKFVSNQNMVYSHGEKVGEMCAKGYGWFRIYTDKVSAVRGLLSYVAKQYATAMNNEIRALMQVASGTARIVAAQPVGPFVSYTTVAVNMETAPLTPFKQGATPQQASNDSLSALVSRFKK